MHFPLVSAWNKRRRSKSYDTDPCTFLFSIIFARWHKSMFTFFCFLTLPLLNKRWNWTICVKLTFFSGVYRAAECWQIDDQAASQPRKRRYGSSVYTLKEMEEATSSFSDENLLGKGGFGRVYKGTLKTGEVGTISLPFMWFTGCVMLETFSTSKYCERWAIRRAYKQSLIPCYLKVVAIKKMDLPPFKKFDGEREFRVEVDILSRLDHPNLVSLIGYCADGKQRFLVYEYMQNGNLQDHLTGKSTK